VIDTKLEDAIAVGPDGLKPGEKRASREGNTAIPEALNRLSVIVTDLIKSLRRSS